MARLGIIGTPSDWLIASNVDVDYAKEKYGIEIVHMDIKELEDIYRTKISAIPEDLVKKYPNKVELDKAYNLYLAVKEMYLKYNLEAITIRCFDLLGDIHTTSCLALALLNEEGMVATCEGDIPSMITMWMIKKVLNKPSFMANPANIDVTKNTIILAHCTVPLDMCKEFKYDTHFESGIGIGIKGELNEEEITIVKLNAKLDKYVCLKGKIVKNLCYKNLCRTQVFIKLDEGEDVSYFLTKPLGNHHMIVYGDVKDQIKEYLNGKATNVLE